MKLRSRLSPLRLFWLAVGVSALALGGLGAALPLLPTTPFMLLAAFAFARSSERLHDWLLGHRVFGPLIRDWRVYGAIGRRAKIFGLLSIAAVLGLSLTMNTPPWVLAVQVVVLGLSATFILSRPSPPTNTVRDGGSES
ncbi:YbaN family protein [Algihabitans albus]|uniref:YbaN family protein n=1 Tax=Algihabitans albus TaxID=2164067 RepID=UPI001F295A8C|nr:YbaN family protein [Algihabitans albus]